MEKVKIGLFFGSNTGATERVAELVKAELENSPRATAEISVDMHVISPSSVARMRDYTLLVFGASTWNIGELQDDWALAFPALDTVDFHGRKVAIFGVGDQFGYPDSFVDAIGIIGDKVTERGGETVGWWPVDETYEFTFSRGVFEDIFMGLAVDEDHQSHLTPGRVASWVLWVLENFELTTPVAEFA